MADEDAGEALIARYLDEGWDGTGWRPSQLLVIGESVFATQQSLARAKDNANEYRRLVLARARQRYRDGFYADPFTKQPKRRDMAA